MLGQWTGSVTKLSKFVNGASNGVQMIKVIKLHILFHSTYTICLLLARICGRRWAWHIDKNKGAWQLPSL